MKIIGLTGGSGSGKGLAGRFFSSFGCAVIDTDKLYHSMIDKDSPCSRAIIAEFGEIVAADNGAVVRERLAEIVFSDKEKLSSLNSIAHSFVRAECDNIIEKEREEGREIVVIDAPQLFEADMQDICDATVAVVSDKSTRVGRICARDGICESKANARISSQHTDAFFVENCDYVIENNSDAAHLLAAVKKVLDKIKGRD